MPLIDRLIRNAAQQRVRMPWRILAQTGIYYLGNIGLVTLSRRLFLADGALHPDLDRWMIEEGYGKVLGRPRLDLPERELCISSLLVGLGAPIQLYSHLRGALQVGVPPTVVARVLDAITPVVPASSMELARGEWDRLLGQEVDRRSGQTSPGVLQQPFRE